jgi:hypothetical protein
VLTAEFSLMIRMELVLDRCVFCPSNAAIGGMVPLYKSQRCDADAQSNEGDTH